MKPLLPCRGVTTEQPCLAFFTTGLCRPCREAKPAKKRRRRQEEDDDA